MKASLSALSRSPCVSGSGCGAHAASSVILPGSITERAFLGETWDYAFRAEACDLKLRVMSPPVSVFTVGQKVWLEINPSHIIPIQDDQHA